ncbi:MAG: DUF3343 domain-containing protein [Clostridia bacterium]|nr:DUF3343 domain-containing protein [Clostridia bacterium]
MYLVAVFRARTQTLSFANLLESYGVPVVVINTPRHLNISCGISVKFPASFRHIAEGIISRRTFDTFAGIYQS